ncbi:MAG: helix-turn-helix domain-containing protein [Bacteroidales bacterium]|nr:helix-turn-helix domain-containing protein [Bacteroidales bacterium]
MNTRYSDSEIIQILGERLRKYRIALGLTQAELSAKAGVSKMTIHKFESGTAGNVSMQTLLSLLRYTGLLGNFEALIPDVPASPYSSLSNRKRVRHGKAQQ